MVLTESCPIKRLRHKLLSLVLLVLFVLPPVPAVAQVLLDGVAGSQEDAARPGVGPEGRLAAEAPMQKENVKRRLRFFFRAPLKSKGRGGSSYLVS